MDENTIIRYILSTLNNPELAIKLASRGNLPGADDLYVNQFRQLFSSGQYQEAAKVAANSPRGILRTAQTIEQFKQVPAQAVRHSHRAAGQSVAYIFSSNRAHSVQFYNTSEPYSRRVSSTASSLWSSHVPSLRRVASSC